MSSRRRAAAPPTVAAASASSIDMRMSRTASAMQKAIEVVLLEPGFVFVAMATLTPASIARRASG